MRNHYKVLGVSITSTHVEIKAAYRKFALKYHPDKTSKDEENIRLEKTEKFREITDAYTILNDPDTRDAYDRALRARNYETANKNAGYKDRGRSSSYTGPNYGWNPRRPKVRNKRSEDIFVDQETYDFYANQGIDPFKHNIDEWEEAHYGEYSYLNNKEGWFEDADGNRITLKQYAKEKGKFGANYRTYQQRQADRYRKAHSTEDFSKKYHSEGSGGSRSNKSSNKNSKWADSGSSVPPWAREANHADLTGVRGFSSIFSPGFLAVNGGALILLLSYNGFG